MRTLSLCVAAITSLWTIGPIRGDESAKLVVQIGSVPGVSAIAASRDGKFLATTGTYDTAVVLWDVATRHELRRFSGHDGSIESVEFFDRDRKLLTASLDKTARIWDFTTGKQLQRFVGHTDYLSAAAITSDGLTVATASHDKTVRTWDAQTGGEKLVLKGHRDKVQSVAISPDDKFLISGDVAGFLYLWDRENGTAIKALELPRGITRVVWLPDSVHTLVGLFDGRVALMTPANGKLVRIFAGHTDRILGLCATPDGKKVVATSVSQVVTLHDIETGKVLQSGKTRNVCYCGVFLPDNDQLILGDKYRGGLLYTSQGGLQLRDYFTPLASYVAGVAVAPDGTQLFASGSQPMGMWNLAEGRMTRGLNTGSEAALGTVYAHWSAYSPDGKRLAIGFKNHSIGIFDPTTGRQLNSMVGHPDKAAGLLGAAMRIVFSPNGQLLFSIGQDGILRAWDVETGQPRIAFSETPSPLISLAVANDNKTIVTGGQDKKLRFWNLETGKLVKSITAPDWVVGITIRADKKSFFAGGAGGFLNEYDLETGEELRKLDAVAATYVSSLALAPDGKSLAVGELVGRMSQVDVATGKVLRRFPGHDAPVMALAFTPESKRIVSGGIDSSTRIWDAIGDKGELARLVAFFDGTWAVTDPIGRYDAANGGDVFGMHWVVGNEPIALKQLKERYYDPGLLAKHLGFNKEPLREVAAFTAPKLYPDVAAKASGTKLDLTLTNRGGGIGRVVVLVNGKEATADARPRGADTDAAKLAVQLDLTNDPRLERGKKNRVEVLAYNAEGYLSSRGLVREIEDDGRVEAVAPPELWAVVAGVSDYRGDAIDLKFAAKDADDFATAVRVAGNRLFGAERVHLTTLTTTAGEAKSFPSRANLIRALGAVKQSKPGDVVLVYLAGHGVNHGGADGDFYYLTSDAATANLGDPAIRTSTAVSSKELTEILKAIPAQKQVLILDTCASGKLVEKLTEKRDVPGSQVRALEQLKDRTGMYVLAGCASDAVSYEASRYGQGLLTYSLLLGMRGAALKEERVDVATLFGFAADKVPELARDIGGVQRPVVASPRGGQPFPIGLVTAADQAGISLQAVRPLMLRCNLQEEDEFKDVLDLGRKVDDALRTATTRGRDATLVFVDAAELPDAHQLAGRYTIDGENVSVTANVFRGKARVGRVTVKGPKAKTAELAATIATEVEKLLKAAKP